MNISFEQTLFKGEGDWTIKAVQDGPWRAEDYSASAAYLVISHTAKVGGKAVVKLTPVKGKNIGKANETSPLDQAVAEAKSRVLKQRDKGYVDTREQARQPARNALGKKLPMLACPFEDIDPNSIPWDSGRVFMQPKLDGHRSMRDEGVQYSRPGKHQDIPHLEADLKDAPWFEGLHLDGELYVHGLTLQAIGSLIKKYREESLRLEYHIYDIMADLPFIERYAKLEEAFAASEGLRDERIVLVPTRPVRSFEEAEQINAENLAKGYEGSILRISGEGYEDDSRAAQLVKWKPFTDMEVEVFDFEWGTPNNCPAGGEYLNPVLVYRVPGTDITGKVTAPGTHAEKHDQGQNIESFLGNKLLTIKHMGFTPDGVPNIATAKCWKEDL